MKNKQQLTSAILGIVAVLTLVLLDQLTKFWAVTYLKGQESIVLLKNVFQLQYLENQGAAFGIMQGKHNFFIPMTILVLLILVYCYIRIPMERKFRLIRIVMILFVAGAIGNFIDRLTQSYVVDFFYFILINFPVFNVADIYVTVAAFGMILLVLFYYKDQDYEELVNSLRIRKK